MNDEIILNEVGSLSNVANGLAPEVFQKYYQQAIDNAYDTTTPAGESKTVTLKFKVTPVIDPNMGTTRAQQITGFKTSCVGDAKLSKTATIESFQHVVISPEGNPKTVLNDPHQVDIFQQMQQKQNQQQNKTEEV